MRVAPDMPNSILWSLLARPKLVRWFHLKAWAFMRWYLDRYHSRWSLHLVVNGTRREVLTWIPGHWRLYEFTPNEPALGSWAGMTPEDHRRQQG